MSIKKYEIFICDDCINLKGEMCNNPECIFCRRTMKEVEELLDIILIRIKTDNIGIVQNGKKINNQPN